jgi:uncharacterized membrane protein
LSEAIPDEPNAEELEAAGPEILDGEIATPLDSTRLRIDSIGSHFSGPLPPPDMLIKYNTAVPDLAREIVDQWKAETALRHKNISVLTDTDRRAADAYIQSERRAQWLAFILAVVMILVAALAVILDRPAVGVAGMLAAIGPAMWAMRRGSMGIPEQTNLSDGDAVQRTED